MAERIPFQSEGEQLESFLDELQKDQQIKEIAGWETGFPILAALWTEIRPASICSSVRRRAAKPRCQTASRSSSKTKRSCQGFSASPVRRNSASRRWRV
jgi:hypothetical protein